MKTVFCQKWKIIIITSPLQLNHSALALCVDQSQQRDRVQQCTSSKWGFRRAGWYMALKLAFLIHWNVIQMKFTQNTLNNHDTPSQFWILHAGNGTRTDQQIRSILHCLSFKISSIKFAAYAQNLFLWGLLLSQESPEEMIERMRASLEDYKVQEEKSPAWIKLTSTKFSLLHFYSFSNTYSLCRQPMKKLWPKQQKFSKKAKNCPFWK